MVQHARRRIGAAVGAIALLTIAAPAASGHASDAPAAEAELLSHFEQYDVPEHLQDDLADAVLNGEVLMSQQEREPSSVEQFEQILDGVPVTTTIERFEDGSFRAAHVELTPEEVADSGLAVPSSITGCSLGGYGQPQYVGCTVRMEDTIAWADFRADYTVRGGAAQGYGEIHDAYNYAYGAIGGEGLPGGTLTVPVSVGNPARAEAQFSWRLPGGLGGGQFSGNLLVDRNGARVEF